ncbi:hypothetical protein HX823_31735, partial [Pseudomonas sp. P7759]|uniref:hypothetical protein n=1 Tax=Pseudomonas sp. P7759 TaxID=2738831 RepID=UPI0015A0D973
GKPAPYSPPIGRTQCEYNEATHFYKQAHKKNESNLDPLTLEAMRLLDVDDCPESLLESVTLNPEEYQQLLQSGALRAINITLGKIIDDYEDEAIHNLADLTKTVEILNNHLTHENSSTMKKIIDLNTLAIKNRTGLFFF